MSLIQSARLNGHDPYVYLKDVLTRQPTQRASEIDKLLPHQWTPAWVTQDDLTGKNLPKAGLEICLLPLYVLGIQGGF